MMITLSGAEQRLLTKGPAVRRHRIVEMAAGATRCFVSADAYG